MTRRVSFSDFQSDAKCHSSVDSMKLGISHSEREQFTVEDGCLLGGTRVVVPSKYQQEVLSELHLSQPGMARMKSLARLHVWWPNLDGDIEQTVRDCPHCLTAVRHP